MAQRSILSCGNRSEPCPRGLYDLWTTKNNKNRFNTRFFSIKPSKMSFFDEKYDGNRPVLGFSNNSSTGRLVSNFWHFFAIFWQKKGFFCQKFDGNRPVLGFPEILVPGDWAQTFDKKVAKIDKKSTKTDKKWQKTMVLQGSQSTFRENPNSQGPGRIPKKRGSKSEGD